MVRFTVFSDLHYDEMPDGGKRIDELTAHIKKSNPDFVISLGDLCKPAHENNETVLKKLNATGIPVYHTIGNHETDVYSLEKAAEFLSLKSPWYSFKYDNIKFIVLNSCYFKINGEHCAYLGRNYKEDGALYPFIPADEIKWLENELNGAEKYVIFSHHSLVNGHRDRGVYNRKEVRELFCDKNVLLCMNGHDHGDDLSVVDGVHYYTVNSASYVWCGFQIMGSERLTEKYGHLNGFLFYKQALYADVEIDSDEIRITGMDGEYLSVTPDDVELYSHKWNGVSIEPKTSSYVIKIP